MWLSNLGHKYLSGRPSRCNIEFYSLHSGTDTTVYIYIYIYIVHQFK